MKQVISTALIALGLTAAAALPAFAQKHVALIIDNGAARTLAPGGGASSTQRLAQGLEQMRYRVIMGVDQDQSGMRQYMEQFRAALDDADVAFFFFSGLTLDSGGRNVLVARDAAPGQALDRTAVPLDDVVGMMRATRANFLFVDSGYADPRAEALARSLSGVSPAIARVHDRSKFMIALANMPGRVARSDAESPFADALLAHLARSDVTADDLSANLRRDVFARTRGSQLPWVKSQLGNLRLAALPEAAPALPPTTAVTPPIDRVALVRAIQSELRKHQCYSGAVNGNIDATNRALAQLTIRHGRARTPGIELARAGASDFDDWLRWIRAIEAPICTPIEEAAPLPKATPKKPQTRAVARREEFRDPDPAPKASRRAPRETIIEPSPRVSRSTPRETFTAPRERVVEQRAPRQEFREPRQSAPSRSPSGGDVGGGRSGGFNPFAPTR